MSTPKVPLLLAMLFTALSLGAETLSIGPFYYSNYDGFQRTSDFAVAGQTRTAIDVGNPASASGNVTSVRMYWTVSPCPNAIKIKFFRRSGDNLTMVAERGPLSATTYDNVLIMNPPVAIRQGDLIGVARIADCGNVAIQLGETHRSDGYLEYPGDVTGTVPVSAGLASITPLTLNGSGDVTESVRSIVPVVGSTSGANNSTFRTSMQILNPSPSLPTPTSGRLIFHRAGPGGTFDDPSLPFTIGPNQVMSLPDVMQAFGQTGLGSVDVVVSGGAPTPIVVTRAYNEGGTAGTAGLGEETVDLSSGNDPRILSFGSPGYLLAPNDPTKMRFNIGVRTLFAGATIDFTLLDVNGAPVFTVRKSWGPQTFTQTDATGFFGRALTANQPILVNVATGSAFVYGSTTDNISQDPSVQFATR